MIGSLQMQFDIRDWNIETLWCLSGTLESVTPKYQQFYQLSLNNSFYKSWNHMHLYVYVHICINPWHVAAVSFPFLPEDMNCKQ